MASTSRIKLYISAEALINSVSLLKFGNPFMLADTILAICRGSFPWVQNIFTRVEDGVLTRIHDLGAYAIIAPFVSFVIILYL